MAETSWRRDGEFASRRGAGPPGASRSDREVPGGEPRRLASLVQENVNSRNAVETSLDETQRALAWYAIKTRSNHEKLVARALRDKGLGVFLPVSRERHTWSDRTKLVEIPLFSTY